MALSKAAITKALAEAKSTERRVEIWDDDGRDSVRPLHVRATPPSKRNPEGHASFFVRYRVGKTMRREKVGDFGTFTVTTARERARAIMRDVQAGGDPQATKRAGRAVPSVEAAVELYLASLTTKKRTIATYLQRLTKHVVPAWRGRQITDVTAADVRRLHTKITKAGHPVDANRTTDTVRALFSWAMAEWPQITTNPAKLGKHAPVKRNAEDVGDRVMSKDERTALLAALAKAEARTVKAEGHVSRSYANAFRLILVTGMRPIDAVSLRLENILPSVSGGRAVQVATWPQGEASTKKAGQRRILSARALEIIEAQRAGRSEGWVFPNARGGQTTSNQLARTFRQLRAEAELPDDLTLYAARRTYITEGVLAGYSTAVMGADVDNAAAVARYVSLDDVMPGVGDDLAKRLGG